MKKLIIFTAFIGLFSNPMFSQHSFYNKVDTTFKKPSFERERGKFNIVKDKVNIVLPNKYLQGMNRLFSQNTDTNLRYGTGLAKSTYNAHRFNNMPVLFPKGNFSMKVMKPDSTIEYTMLIIKP